MITAQLLPASHPTLRFDGTIGYTIEGDVAQLNADLAVLDQQSLQEQQYALQLWACTEPFSGTALHGTKIAEIPVATDQASHIDAQALALLPAGRQDYTMVMALTGTDTQGAIQLHDYTIFNNRQLFSQPQLEGRIDCQLHDDRAQITIEAIANPRASDNLSGSLSLELWALDAPYEGGAFCGFELARTDLGTLNGGCEWRDSQFNLPLAQLPAGDARSLVLMLREWTPAGYLTRDYRSLQTLAASTAEVTAVAAPEAAASTESPAEAAAELPAAETAEASATVEGVVAEAVAAAAEAEQPPAAQQETAAETATEERSAAEELDVATLDVAAEVQTEPAPAVKVEEIRKVGPAKAVAAVSINEATLNELTAVKGLSKRVADAIVESRPFASVDELTKVRGIGARMLAKLRDLLTL